MNRLKPAPITATRRVGVRLINDMGTLVSPTESVLGPSGPLSATEPLAPSRPPFGWERPSTRARAPCPHRVLAPAPPPHGSAAPLPLYDRAPWHRNRTPS